MATAKNTAAVESPGASGAAIGKDCTDISLWSARAGGDYLGAKAISTDPDALAAGEPLQIAAEALVLTQPAGADETAKMAVRALNGRVSGGLWVQWHEGAPGAAGTDNVIPVLGRTQVAQAGWTIEE